MKKASAIVTNQGGRTCHAAIIAREMGIPAIVGCGDATDVLKTGQEVTFLVQKATKDEFIAVYYPSRYMKQLWKIYRVLVPNFNECWQSRTSFWFSSNTL
jgi:phosphoenolpyruvate synthase/pyruvate phosphate dikinase